MTLPEGQVEKDGVVYGCHVDLKDGDHPDGCVLDYGQAEDCTFGCTPSGRARRAKWTCNFWRAVKTQRREP